MELRYLGLPPDVPVKGRETESLSWRVDRRMARTRRGYKAARLIVPVLVAAGIAALAAKENVPLPWALAVFVLTLPVVRVATYLVTLWFAVGGVTRELGSTLAKAGAQPQEIFLALDPAGLRFQWGEMRLEVPWANVDNILTGDGGVTFAFPNGGHHVPEDAFESPWQRRDFVERARELHGGPSSLQRAASDEP
ncbi:MAG: hypothetical protein WBV82_20410 [Myxococcaceae bacterium]